jgi:GR25 family glycosyltransferase involved in LPS biosynthesis
MNIPIFYINLDRSIQRNERMIESLNKLDNKFYRVSGVDSYNIDKNALNLNESSCNRVAGYKEYEEFKYQIKPNLKFNPRQKEIAIILSHLRALKYAAENNSSSDYSIIMEDDMSFQYISDWKKQIQTIIEDCPSDWKIIKLHTSTASEIEKNVQLANKNILYTPLSQKAIQSAGCYIIKRDTILELLKNYCQEGIYTFPHKDEFVVCECVIFSFQKIYMYTIPLVCAVDNNVTCVGNANPLDASSNAIIHKYWKIHGGITDNGLEFEIINKKHAESFRKRILPTIRSMIKNKK